MASTSDSLAETFLTTEELVNNTKEFFKQEFSEDAEIVSVAPGRVNLIGEHTDYNGGFVFPMAVPMSTVVVGKAKPDFGNKCLIVTRAKGLDPDRIELPNITAPTKTPKQPPKWVNYIKGVLTMFHGSLEGKGFVAVIDTTVPLGGGLSSSASLEVALYSFLEAMTGDRIEMKVKAVHCQEAEKEYAGMPCGIMDQFISIFGEEGFAVKIDCENLTVDMVNLGLSKADLEVVVINSNIKHELVEGKYTLRRENCEAVGKLLNKTGDKQNDTLRHASLDALNEANAKGEIQSEEMFKQARHAITEIERTREAVKAIKQGNYEAFGKYMNQSHASLRDDFTVSIPEIDQLVEIAQAQEGVLGSRITGGGFGGCTVSLVKKDKVEDLLKKIHAEYSGKATCYVVQPSTGACVLEGAKY